MSAGGQGGLGRGEIRVQVGKEKEGGHPEIPNILDRQKGEGVSEGKFG